MFGKLRMGLVLKFSLCALLFLGLILIILMGLILHQQRETLTGQFIARGKTLSQIYAISCGKAIKEKDDLLLMAYTETMTKTPNTTYALVLDSRNQVLAHSDIKEWGKVYSDPLSLKAATAVKILVQEFVRGEEKYYDIATPLKVDAQKIGVARIAFSTTGIEKEMAAARDQAVITSVIVLVLGILGASLLAVLVIRPLQRMQVAIDALAKGRLDEKLSIRSKDEIGQLAQTLEQGLTQIKNRYRVYEEKITANQMGFSLLLEKIGESLGEGIIFTDSDNNILYVNEKAQGILFGPEKVVDKHLLEAVKNVELMELIRKSMENPNQLLREELRSKECKVHLTTVESREKEIVGMVILLIPRPSTTLS